MDFSRVKEIEDDFCVDTSYEESKESFSYKIASIFENDEGMYYIYMIFLCIAMIPSYFDFEYDSLSE